MWGVNSRQVARPAALLPVRDADLRIAPANAAEFSSDSAHRRAARPDITA